ALLGRTRRMTSLAPMKITARSNRVSSSSTRARSSWSARCAEVAPGTAVQRRRTGRSAAAEMPRAIITPGVWAASSTAKPAAMESPAMSSRIARPVPSPWSPSMRGRSHWVNPIALRANRACKYNRATVPPPTSVRPPPPNAVAAAIRRARAARSIGSLPRSFSRFAGTVVFVDGPVTIEIIGGKPSGHVAARCMICASTTEGPSVHGAVPQPVRGLSGKRTPWSVGLESGARAGSARLRADPATHTGGPRTRSPRCYDARELEVRVYDSLIDLVGDTPLIRLGKVTEELGPNAPTVLAKVEYFNPGGSVKDRIALRMVEAAEKGGELAPGGTIVEPTSGNTGIGLAMVAQDKGYRCVFVCPDKVGADKLSVLRAYGAEVVVCPTAVAPDHPDSYYSVSDRLAREIPGGWKPNQYENMNNPDSHYHDTGPEIWEQTKGRITHFVAGIGTGGTISGIGRYLKEVSDGRVKVIGADPEGSVYSGGSGRPSLVEWAAQNFCPRTYDTTVCDEIVAISDKDSFLMTRRLAKEEALLVGGSCGLAVEAALRVAKDAGPEDVIVVLLPDGGRGYLGKIFNDEWMAD